MGQNKNFIAARLPQELYDRLESTAGDKKGEKTRIIIQAIAAYLDFPLPSTDTGADNDGRFIALENRIAELEQQFQEFKEFVINRKHTDNKDEIPVILTDNSNNSSDNSVQSNIAVDNKGDNKATALIQNDGSIGPAPESQIAEFLGISRGVLTYHRKTLKDTSKPLNQPRRVEYNNKSYDLICQGESKSRGKTIFLWIAKPVIKADNKAYQPDITEYQADNNLFDTLQNQNQDEQKQASESLEITDNTGYQELSVQPHTNQEGDEEDSQDPKIIDNDSYQTLSEQSDSNEELNEQKSDLNKQLTAEHQEHQTEFPVEEQPEF